MVSKTVTNHTRSPLGLPDGPTVPAMGEVFVPNWEKKENNDVVKAWLAAGALTLSAGKSEAQEEADIENTIPANTVEADAARETELRKMTNANLAKFIEENGGTVPANGTKDELVKAAMDVPPTPEELED